MIQVIKYKCCGRIFAACKEPECYIDKDWLKDLRQYVKEGCKVEMITGDWQFGKCDCKKPNEPNLFNQ